MTWRPIAFLPPQYETTPGVPYSGAVLKFYAPETTDPILAATTYEGTTLASSFVLNAAGYPTSGGMVIIPHLSQDYKIALYPSQAAADNDSGAVWTVDNIKIAEEVSASFVQSFSGDGTTQDFTLSEDLGTDENTIMVFADKKFGEYSTNGGFATDTGWTKGAGWAIGSGVASATTASTDLEQSTAIPTIPEESYTIAFTITRSAGDVTPKIGGRSGTTRNASGTYIETIIAGSGSQLVEFTGNGFTGTLDNVSIHRTTASRREICRPDEITISGTALRFNEAPAAGTSNIIVFAPSLLFGQLGGLVAAAATSESNAAASAELAATTGGFKYIYDSNTASADPTAGKLRFNNATLSAATALYISETTDLAQAIAAEIATWDDSSSTIHGKLRLFKQTDPSVFVLYDVTGTNTDNGTWVTLTVAYVGGSGVIANTDVLTVQYLRTGDKGAKGDPGGPIVDGNYGDITASGGGSVLTINALAVTAAKIADATITYAKMAAGALASAADILAGTASKLIDAATFKTYAEANLRRLVYSGVPPAATNYEVPYTFKAGYNYTIILDDIEFSAVSSNLSIQFRATSGGAYYTGGSDYTWKRVGGTTSVAGDSSAGSSAIIASLYSQDTSYPTRVEVHVPDPNNAGKRAYAKGDIFSTVGATIFANCFWGTLLSDAAIDRIKFINVTFKNQGLVTVYEEKA